MLGDSVILHPQDPDMVEGGIIHAAFQLLQLVRNGTAARTGTLHYGDLSTIATRMPYVPALAI